MSLFKAREWWSYNSSAGPEELYSSYSVIVAPFKHLTGSHTCLIVTGSLTGIVRIFNPAVRQHHQPDDHENLASNKDTTSSPNDDLLLEINLKSPVLEVEVGQFSR